RLEDRARALAALGDDAAHLGRRRRDLARRDGPRAGEGQAGRAGARCARPAGAAGAPASATGGAQGEHGGDRRGAAGRPHRRRSRQQAGGVMFRAWRPCLAVSTTLVASAAVLEGGGFLPMSDVNDVSAASSRRESSAWLLLSTVASTLSPVSALANAVTVPAGSDCACLAMPHIWE